MLPTNRQAIALISDHADPAADIGAEEAGGQNVYVRQVGDKVSCIGMASRYVHPQNRSASARHCRTFSLLSHRSPQSRPGRVYS